MTSHVAAQAASAHSSASLRVKRDDGQPLRACVEAALRQYLSELDGHAPSELYHMVVGEVEYPLLKTVMAYTGGNQSHAAGILGINRSTLRKKLRQHGLDR